MRMFFSRAIVALLLAALGGRAGADAPVGPEEAAFVRRLHAGWYVPQAALFADAAGRLQGALQALCAAASDDQGAALAAARARWTDAIVAWERFSAVRGGALLARRSPREIDFTPARPEAIRRAVQAAPADARAMELVGAPGKGLPALEWLLWTQPARAGSPECRYAERAAEAVRQEASALHDAYRSTLARGWDERETEYALYEFLNLYDASVQKLWWEDMARPLRKAATGGPAVPSRSASGATRAAWRAHWQALRALALGDGSELPALQALLVAKGQPAAAMRLAGQVRQLDDAMAPLDDRAATARPDPRQVERAVAALRGFQQFVETDLAAALQFVISFFDEDGD